MQSMILKNPMPYNEEASLNSIRALLKTVHRLRAPGGCPWDQEQTHQSLRQYLIEETYETIEVLDQVKSPDDLKSKPLLRQAFLEEWGDVFLQILLNAEVASETSPEITIEQIAQTLNEKLIRRHPHVFGPADGQMAKVTGSAEVVKNWDEIKKAEKGEQASVLASVLDGVSKGLPPLPRTMKVIQKVTKVGFQWPDLAGPTEKLQEEVQELKEALTHSDLEPEEFLAKVESEIGDVLFSTCNIAYFLKLDPETALRSTLRKFETRFRYVETRLQETGKTPKESNLAEMDLLWAEAKKIERGIQK
jgi:tetrapyrrole methylase family protein/MazG family protein